MDEVKNTELDMLLGNKESGYNYRERRHTDWTENYELYRDKVTYNRLTQRQSVNIPLMKMMLRTLLKDVDDMPVMHFDNLDDDKDAEIFENEYWKYIVEKNNMKIQDVVDKRQVFHFGRSFDQWQIEKGTVKMTLQDPMKVLVSRYTDPTHLHSSRFLIHTGIFVPLRTLQGDERYDQEAIGRLIQHMGSETGLIVAKDNQDMLLEENQKLSDMGVTDINDPVLGETYVELNLYFTYGEGTKKKNGRYGDEELYLYVVAQDMVMLQKTPLDEVIGKTKDDFFKTHFPYVSWADDVERQDFWSDGIADMVRTPNKILNSMFSQLIENRTLRNYNMKYYDSSIEGFAPPTNQPLVPGGWYPVKGKPQDVMMNIDVPDLSESLDEMNFLMGVMEKATGATATQQGAQTERKTTLGEVQLALGEAKERIKGMAKFYTKAWEDRGQMFIKLLEAGGNDIEAVKVYKKGRNTDAIYSREIGPKDWKSEAGYVCKVWSQDERNTENSDKIQKVNAAKNVMPDNPIVDTVFKRKMLEFSDLSPEEIDDAMKFEEEKRKALTSMMTQGPQMMQPGMGMGQQIPPPPPVAPLLTKTNGVKKKKTVSKLRDIRSTMNGMNGKI